MSKSNTQLLPPVPVKKPNELSKHGDTRIDNYYWLRDRDNPEVIAYLEEENRYLDQMTSHTKDLQALLFEEMKGRIKEDDTTVPYKKNGYWYITKFVKDKNYPIYVRKKESLSSDEALVFDCNVHSEGYSYFKIVGLNVSKDNKLLAYGVDTLGRRNYDVRIKNLETGELYPEIMKHTTGGSTWSSDCKTLFYTIKDEKTLRPYKIFKHVLGTPVSEDVEVYHEVDETYSSFVYKTKSEDFLVIGSFNTVSSEYRILSADDPDGEFKLFHPRKANLEYAITHYKDYFYILTNADDAINFKLMKTPVKDTAKEAWVDVIPHRDDVLIEDVDIFKDYLVISERSNGLNKINIKKWDGSEDYYLPFDNETYSAEVTINPEFDTKYLRYAYNSLTTPNSVIDFDMETRQKDIKKEQEILGGKFDKNNYASERVWATGEEGIKIPISLVYKKGMKKDGENPVLLYGYGSYGNTTDPNFSSVRLSLLDRGFIYAIAHVRGSEYLGRSWYENGKLLNKKKYIFRFY